MADKTTIINRALANLGAEPIVNITDNTPEAQIANRYYDESRKAVLSECLWTFATKRALLNESTDTLDFYTDDMNYVYVLPSDIIRIFQVNTPSARWYIEQEYLISDASGMGIKYVFDQTDTTKFSASFVDAFADRLAADMCYAVINSNTESKLLLEKYNGESLPKAMSENAQIGTPIAVNDSLWVDAKYGFRPVNDTGRIIA